MPELTTLLAACIKHDPSDILLIPGKPPILRVHGKLIALPDSPPLTAAECKQVIYVMLDERQRAHFEKNAELDFAFHAKDIALLRVNVYLQHFGVAAALRVIPKRIPKPSEIDLGASVLGMADLPRGLVLVTGPTGSGKSTTLASLIQHINETKHRHILTIEDPIEFIYLNDKCIIDQREVGKHTASFTQALTHSLRQNPDIILIGEMRDRNTMELAIKAAETGHLCFSTLHTKDAPSTIQRIISEFPSDQHERLCAQLSSVLCGVISQTLIPIKDGRICVRGVMIMNSAIRNLIRDNKIHQIYGAIESGIVEGMFSADQALAALVQKRLITTDEAALYALNASNFHALLKSGVDFSELGRPQVGPT